MKIKMKFKPVHPDGSVVDGDVIVLKVKRADWLDFSRLLGAAHSNAEQYRLNPDVINKIESKFDGLYAVNS